MFSTPCLTVPRTHPLLVLRCPKGLLASLKPDHELTPSALKSENSGTLDDNLIEN